jgi:copper homeostasis protein (lipoprotein)
MKLLLISMSFLMMLFSCQQINNQGDDTDQSEVSDIIIDKSNSRNSLDWNGAYKSILPCSDCSGIAIQIQLNLDGSFEMHSKYMGKGDEVYLDKGMIEWDEAGGKIKLLIEGQDPDLHHYQVGENALFKLDGDGKRIGEFDSPYTFVKVGSILDY